MKILFATSEVYPLIKTGGLADVCYSLPIALEHLGHDVKIVVPFYRSIKDKIASGKCIFQGEIFGYIGEVSVYTSSLSEDSQVEVYLVDAPALFDRDGGPYTDKNNEEWGDSAYRFTVFSRVVAMLGNDHLGMNWSPDLVHCNDWQTGLVIPLLQLEESPPATLFTIHNLAYQGNFSKEEFDHLLLPEHWWSIEGLEFYGECSFLKAGIVNADWVTTVSPNYAREVKTPDFGERFEGILQHKNERFVGILNGVDYAQWSPTSDTHINTNFTVDDIDLKYQNKLALQEHLGLKGSADIPVIGMICRMAYQKGVDLLIECLPSILKNNVQIVILGSGDIYYEEALKEIQRKHPGKFSLTVAYNEALSHQIEAGADFFLMPSRYEPCGLNQIYSLSYGTLPIVRNTGGLADTVVDANKTNIMAGTSTGFVFEDAQAEQLQEAVERALQLYQNKKHLFQMQKTAMSKDFSWEKSSRDYESLYRLAVQNGD